MSSSETERVLYVIEVLLEDDTWGPEESNEGVLDAFCTRDEARDAFEDNEYDLTMARIVEYIPRFNLATAK